MRMVRPGWAVGLVVIVLGTGGRFLQAGDSAPEKLPVSALTAKLENVGFMKDGGETIEADFVLKNGSQWPVRLAERWNSWGAGQWTFQMTNADGSVVEWRNPQMGWLRNHLTVATIPPGGELRLKCLLLWHQPRSRYEESTFVPTEKSARLLLPVKLRGVFAAKLEKVVPANPPALHVPVDREVVSTNWEGTIQTPEVVLERRETIR